MSPSSLPPDPEPAPTPRQIFLDCFARGACLILPTALLVRAYLLAFLAPAESMASAIQDAHRELAKLKEEGILRGRTKHVDDVPREDVLLCPVVYEKILCGEIELVTLEELEDELPEDAATNRSPDVSTGGSVPLAETVAPSGAGSAAAKRPLAAVGWRCSGVFMASLACSRCRASAQDPTAKRLPDQEKGESSKGDVGSGGSSAVADGARSTTGAQQLDNADLAGRLVNDEHDVEEARDETVVRSDPAKLSFAPLSEADHGAIYEHRGVEGQALQRVARGKMPASDHSSGASPSARMRASSIAETSSCGMRMARPVRISSALRSSSSRSSAENGSPGGKARARLIAASTGCSSERAGELGGAGGLMCQTLPRFGIVFQRVPPSSCVIQGSTSR